MKHRLTGLSKKAIVEIIHAIRNIPAEVTTLDLSHNELGSKTVDQLGQVLASIPASVTTLNLSGNYLMRMYHDPALAQALANIPETITELSLALNGLYDIPGEKLAQAFISIPETVTILNLAQNDFRCLGLEKIQLLNGSLPNIKTIYLSYQDVEQMDPESLAAFKNIFPNLSNTVFLDWFMGEPLGVSGIKCPPTRTNNPFQCANFARRLGFPATLEIPSLTSHAAFFIKEKGLDITELPLICQSIVKTPIMGCIPDGLLTPKLI